MSRSLRAVPFDSRRAVTGSSIRGAAKASMPTNPGVSQATHLRYALYSQFCLTMKLFKFFRRGRRPPSLEQVRAGPPDPVFVGEFLVHSFVESHFGLSDADLEALCAPLLETVRDLARLWINLYLCWILRAKIRAEYGEDFLTATFREACAYLARGEHLPDGTAGFADALSYWFEQLDTASSSIGQTVNGIQLPMEYFAALSFLALAPESPFFKQVELPSGLELEVAQVLQRAKTTALPLIELVGEVGGPLK